MNEMLKQMQAIDRVMLQGLKSGQEIGRQEAAARIRELEAQLEAANQRIAELEKVQA